MQPEVPSAPAGLREQSLVFVASEVFRGDPAVALQLTDDALRTFPDSIELQRARAYALQELGQGDAALGVLQSTLSAYDQRAGSAAAEAGDPVREQLVAQTAAALMLMGRPEQAQPFIGWLERVESPLLSTVPDHVPVK